MYSTKYCKLMWVGLLRSRNILKSTRDLSAKNNLSKKLRVPTAIGFSIFTWLGFEEKKVNPEDELILTIKHSVLFIQRKEYEKAEQLLHIGLRQAQQLNHQLGVTYIYDVMANLALETNQLDKAKKLFVAVAQRLMSNGATEDDPSIVHISLKLARVSHLQKEYDTAQLGYDWCLEKLNVSMKKDPTEDIIKLLAITEDWYGRLYLDCNNNEHGLNLMASALNHMREVEGIEDEHLVVQLNDLGTVCDRLNRLDESIDYFKQAIDKGKDISQYDDLGALHVNIGRVYMKKNLLVEARKNCGYGWRLGFDRKNVEVQKEAEHCLKEVKELS